MKNSSDWNPSADFESGLPMNALFPATAARTGNPEHWVGTQDAADILLEDRTLMAILDEIIDDVVVEVGKDEHLYDFEIN